MRILTNSFDQARTIISSFGAVLIVSLTTSCSSGPVFSRTVYEDPTVLVRLDSPLYHAEVSGAPPALTVELTAEDLAEILRSIKIQPEISFLSYWVLRKEPQPEPAFPGDDAELLAPHLQAALAKAQPGETAVFFLQRARKDNIPLVTTGGLLIRNNQLVIVLAHVRKPVTTPRKLATARDTPLHPFGEVNFHFVPGAYQATLAGKDLPRSLAATSAPALTVDYRAWLSALLLPSRESPFQTQPGSQAATIEEKLRRLKTWREWGLITDDDYLQKRREILKHF